MTVRTRLPMISFDEFLATRAPPAGWCDNRHGAVAYLEFIAEQLFAIAVTGCEDDASRAALDLEELDARLDELRRERD